MGRAIILLLDSFGIGATDDADKYDDVGSNTFGHIVQHCAHSGYSKKRSRQGDLYIPHLSQLGLYRVAEMSAQASYLKRQDEPIAKFGFAKELSFGKDTPSGHWEIAGVPVLFNWGYFPPNYPSFPDELLKSFIEESHLEGILGNRHASGTQIIEELGDEHMRTGQPIVYTSADSVFQIAAHEESFGLDKLYSICEIARRLVDPYNIGRVIARPFSGNPGGFYRTGNRRDYSMLPPSPTLLDNLIAAGGKVIAIGKTADIFAHQGVSREIKAHGNMAIFDATLEALEIAENKTLIFANFVDFDSSYGHRRDVEGYAAALEAFDARLPELETFLNPDDIIIITADHGCDPTWQGSDHTREHIPILMFGQKVKPGNIGKRETFADIGQTLAEFFKLEKLNYGTSFLHTP